jgi:excisionase family DNA binding protein
MDHLILTTREAAEATGLAVPTLNKLRVYGGGPPFLKLGRSVRYRLDDLQAWLESRLVSNTSESSKREALVTEGQSND